MDRFHLVQHTGAKGELFRRRDEAQANRWAARALIPWADARAEREYVPRAVLRAWGR